MPIPSVSNAGAILQYAGETTSDFTKGYFYECVLDGGSYKWIQKAVQPGGGGSSQVVTLPPASLSELNNIYQYIGGDTLQYKNACFYKCVEDTTPGTYYWKPVSVEDPATYEHDPIDFDNDW